MHTRSRRPGFIPLIGLLLLGVSACDSATTSPPVDSNAAIRVINGTTGDVRVRVDGDTRIAQLGAASISGDVAVPEGTRMITFESMSGTTVLSSSSAEVAVSAGGVRYVSVIGAGGALEAGVVADTGAIAAPGTTKMRVIHMAAGAPPIEALRKQPDWPIPLSLVVPFEYGDASGFIQSAPGTWEIIIRPPYTPEDSTSGGTPPAALVSRSFILTAGQVVTAVLLDAGGGALKIEPLVSP